MAPVAVATLLLLFIPGSPLAMVHSQAIPTPYSHPCRGFNLTSDAPYDDDGRLYGRIEFGCVGCCGYDEIVHKLLLEKALEDFLEAEHVCHGAEYNEGDKEEGGGVLYVSLDSWVEGPECLGRRLDQGGLRRGRRLSSTGGSNYSSCKNCGKKKKKKSRRPRHLGGEEVSLLVLSAFGSLPVWGDQVDMNSALRPDDKDGSNAQGPFHADEGSLWSEEDAGSEEGQERRLGRKRERAFNRGFMRGHKKGYKRGFNRGFKRGVKFDNDDDEPISSPTAAATPLDCSGIVPPCSGSARRLNFGREMVAIPPPGLLDFLRPIFPLAISAVVESHTLSDCSYGTEECSSSAGTCCGSVGCECNKPSDSLCEYEDCCLYQSETYTSNFCDDNDGCQNDQCFEIPSPDDICNGEGEVPECCFAIGGESLSPDYCAGENGCPDPLDPEEYCMYEQEIPTPQPTSQPSTQPTEKPTTQPTAQLTDQPSIQPTMQLTTQPTVHPTENPSSHPSTHPIMQPTVQLTVQPLTQPTVQPTAEPTSQATEHPTVQLTEKPSSQSSIYPTAQPTAQLTDQPSTQPTPKPSSHPSTHPTMQPTVHLTDQPSTQPTVQPTTQPMSQATEQPTPNPSSQPSTYPTTQTTAQLTDQPSTQPTMQPMEQPTVQPTPKPSLYPSTQFTTQPSVQLTDQPSTQPTVQPTAQPLSKPTELPTAKPSPTPKPTTAENTGCRAEGGPPWC